MQVLWCNEYHIFGNVDDLCEWYNGIIKNYDLGIRNKNCLRRVITYIHNAKFDLSHLIPFFKKYLPDYVDESGNPLKDGKGRPLVLGTLSLDEHEIIQYCQGGLMFRCSYKLTNRSLANWGEVMNVKHKKKVGYYDYSKIRFPDEIDKLSKDEQDYDKHDVLCLYEALMQQMYFNNEALASYNGKKVVPLTATGYPRRDLSNSCLMSDSYMKLFNESRMTGELYHACLSAYSGGYTHNNRFMSNICVKVGDTVTGHNGKKIKVNDIMHRDFVSFYPSILRKSVFPFGKWYIEYDAEKDAVEPSLDEIIDLYPRQTAIVYMRVHSAWLRDLCITMPFMQDCKLIYDKQDLKKLTCDNGRIVYIEFKKGMYADLYIDNVTLSILNEQYVIDSQILKVWTCKNIPLPKEITEVIDKYFKGKSDKKNAVKECIKLYGELDERTLKAEAELHIYKSWLNGIYGVFATRIVRETWEFDNQTLQFKLNAPFDPEKDNKEEIAEKILAWEYEGVEHYYESNKSFVPFIIGVMTTALARKELFTFITRCIGYDHTLYVDTDSAYYISTPEIEKRIDDMNALNKASAPFVTLSNNKRVYYDYFDSEGHLRAFKGLHSKCYGYVNERDEFKLTVAGVPARTITGTDENGHAIYLTREDELRYYKEGQKVCNECGTIEALDKLTDGYIFYINTGMTAKYINYGEIREFNIDGHKIRTGGGCILIPAEHKEIKPFKITEFTEKVIKK